MADTAPKKRQYSEAKRQADKARSKTRVNLGLAFSRWREMKQSLGMRSDAEFAFFLMDSYLWPKPEKRPERPALERSSSTETCQTADYENPLMMSSPSEVEEETCAASSVQSSENGKESGIKDAACQRLKCQNEWMPTNQSENKDNRVDPHTDIQEDKDEEFSASLTVGDGCYLVDLGSSSEFIVDEECILQLFKSCRQCHRQCTVRKHVRGLKLVVHQTCCFCQSHSQWTNLPDDDDGDFQINGKDAACERNNSATRSPSSNIS
nr:uncharacterized protein LOC124069804 isoform X2 [Scatophagus argus]